MAWVLLFLYLVATVAVGCGPAWLLLRRTGDVAAEIWLPVAFAMGLGLQGALLMAAVPIVGTMSFWFAGIGVIGVVAWAAVVYTKAQAEERDCLGGFSFISGPDQPSQRGVYWIAFALILLLFAIVYTNAASYPFTSYDGRAIWTYKAKILLHTGTPYSEAFLDDLRPHYHPDYPLLLPSIQYTIFTLLGGVMERPVRFLFSSFFVFQVMFLFGIARRIGGSSLLAMMLALLYCATPFRDDWSERDGGALNSGAVDIPLSFFALAAVGFFLLWWREGHRRFWLLGAIFVGLCLMTKKEGMVILAVITAGNLAQALCGRLQDGQRRLYATGWALAAAAMAVLVALPWLWIGKDMPNFYDEKFGPMIRAETLELVPGRTQVILWFLQREILHFEKWNAYWLVFALMVPVMVVGWFTRRAFFLDVIILSWMAAYLFVYYVTPLQLIFHLDTSISRLLSHILPLVLFRLGLLALEWNPLGPRLYDPCQRRELAA